MNKLLTAPSSPYRIGLLLIDGFSAMAYASVTEPLRAANFLAEQTLFDVRHIPVSGARAISSGKTELRADAQLGEQSNYDLMLVIADGNLSHFNDRRVFQWLRHLARRGVMLGGVSGGSMILASAGVMQGRRMTIHWEYAAVLSEIYPFLLIERTGVAGMAYVSVHKPVAHPAGKISPLLPGDQGMHHIQWCSSPCAGNPVPVYYKQRCSGLTERYQTHNPIILTTIDIMRNHLADPLDLSQLSQLSNISIRQLNRLFHDHMKVSPMNFYRGLRLEKAYDLLEKSALSMMEVASATGFIQAPHFSTAFTRQYGKSPSQVRRDSR